MPAQALGRPQQGARLILRSRLASVALLSGWLLLGGLPTSAYASETAAADTAAPADPAASDASASNETSILGYWRRGEGEAIIEVRRKADGYHGVIVDGGQRPETVGIEVFRGLRYDKVAGEWHGRAYSIKRKREVPIDIKVPSANALELIAHIMIFKKRVDFKRIPDAQVTGIQVADR